MHLRLQHGIRVEEIGGEAIVLDRDGSIAHRISGDAARALRLAEQGVDQREVPAELEEAVASLAEAGIIETEGWSRRKLLLAGGVATAGITTFALASPAAAASVCPNGEIVSTVPFTATNGATFVTGPGHPNVVIYAWGGGGGGARSDRNGTGGDGGGGGGGGGAIAFRTVALTTCKKYTCTVSGGGAGAGSTNTGDPGADGGALTFTLNASAVTGNGGKGGTSTAGLKGGAGGTSTAGGGVSSFVGGTGGNGATGGDNRGGGGGGGSAGSTGAGGTGSNASGGTGGGGGAAGTGGTGLTGFKGGAGGTGGTGSAGTGAGAGGGGGGSTTSNQSGGNGIAGKAVVN